MLQQQEMVTEQLIDEHNGCVYVLQGKNPTLTPSRIHIPFLKNKKIKILLSISFCA
jgi:hypothetical protein